MIRRHRQRNNRRHPGRESRRGFTLLEVLIALSVLGVTMAAAFSLFSAGMELREATRERMAFEKDGRLLLRALRDDLANLVPSGPAPLVAPDAIVLWRQRSRTSPAVATDALSQLVVYRWSGSAWQDSLLLRVTIPMAAGVADSAFVHDEFRKWAGLASGGDEDDRVLVREGPGSNFGANATLGGSSGAWVAYPAIRGFACGVVADRVDEAEDEEEVDEEAAEAISSRLTLRLSPVAIATMTFGSLGGRAEGPGRELELMLRMPIVLDEAHPEVGAPVRGVS